MPLFTCGINHQTTPIAIRERLAFNSEQIKAILNDLCRMEAVNEAVLLSTCNRTEIYMHGPKPESAQVWFRQQSSVANINMDVHCYLHQDQAAVKHLLRVSSGLDSMVLGETQILGQIKQAYQLACETGAAGQQLQHLFPAMFAASKTIRNETQISANPISMAYVSVQTAKRIFTNLSQCQVLLIGAGELMELMLHHLRTHGVHKIMIANRDLNKATRLLGGEPGNVFRISEIPSCLSQADIVVTATASQLPIIGKGMVERTQKNRKHRPMLMIDLAVPRDIEPEVGKLADIYLYNMDDLQTIIETNSKHRRLAAQQAEALVEMQTAHYMRQLQIASISDFITQFRSLADQHREEALAKALADLKQGRDPFEVATQLANQLTNKLLHHPTIKLRQLAYHQQAEALLLAKQILLSESE